MVLIFGFIVSNLILINVVVEIGISISIASPIIEYC